jgi:Rieske Fe-S protein
MIRTALIAVAAIAATVAATEVAAQSGTPVRKLNAGPAANWIAISGGEQNISHCIIGPRSDASNPQPGKPQFMIAADRELVLLRVPRLGRSRVPATSP